MSNNFPFNDLKILDFTNECGAYSTKLFADLGAEVVKIEPPVGESSRTLGPFYDNKVDQEGSLYFQYLNTNKKSVVLNIETESGQSAIKELVKHYDVIFENFPPGYMTSLGLGYDDLKAINPKLIMTSITPFGQTGPYKDYVATDIVSVAMGGLMYLGGYPDTPPIMPYGNQSYFASSLFGAVGTLLAIYHRDRTGIGQYIDVSMQESVAMGLENAAQFYDLEGVVRKRIGAVDKQAGWGLYPCKDGQVYIMTAGLSSSGGWQNLIQWMIDIGIKGAQILNDPAWDDFDWRSTNEARKTFFDLFNEFSSNRTKLELYVEGQKRKVPICPVNNTQDVLKNPQLLDRRFFKKVFHDELKTDLIYPGPPYLFSEMEWSLRKSAPKIGENTIETLLKAGFSSEEIQELKEGGVLL